MVCQCKTYNTCMSRGLGGVQRSVMRIAYDNDASGGEPDLVYPEILAGHFLLPLVRPARGASGWKFKKSLLSNYNAASAAVSRAVNSLAGRGLVKVLYVRNNPDPFVPARAEVRLTEEGFAVAKKLFDASNGEKRPIVANKLGGIRHLGKKVKK